MRKALVLNLAVMLWGTRLASYLFYRVMSVGEDKRLVGKPFCCCALSLIFKCILSFTSNECHLAYQEEIFQAARRVFF